MSNALSRWLRDWRTIAAVTAAVLVGLLAVLVVTSIADREQTLHALQGATASEREARAAAVHRIDQLLAKISDLEVDAQSNAQQLAVLRREVTLLQQQVRELGGQPVITASASSDGSPRPQSSASARPTPSATHSPTPRPSPSPSRVCILIICH